MKAALTTQMKQFSGLRITSTEVNAGGLFLSVLGKEIKMGIAYDGLENVRPEKNEEQGSRKVYELSEDEERLLCSIFIDEKRIRSGKLYMHQAAALEELRFGTEYLKNKYPDINIVIQSFSRSNTAVDFARLIFTAGDEKKYSVKVSRENDTFSATDDYMEN